VASFLPQVQPLLETTPQLVATCALQVDEPTTARALQAGIVQLLLGTALGTMHIHSTCLVGVRGWVESQVLWCNAHNVWVGVRMVELAVLQLMQPIGARSTTRGPTNQEVGAPPL
jgi:hypothetical protein